MKTVQLVRTDVDPELVVVEETVTDNRLANAIRRYRLTAELKTRDHEGVYVARTNEAGGESDDS